jgi:hypothetical protein
MNPLDFLTIRLAKDNNLQYYGGSMFGADYGYNQNQPTRRPPTSSRCGARRLSPPRPCRRA